MSLETDKIEVLSPLVRRITAGNSSVFTGPGTNTYLIGIDKVTVLDPGPAIKEHIEAISKCSGEIEQIVVTHTHPDHSPGVKLLQDILDIPAFGLISEMISKFSQCIISGRDSMLIALLITAVSGCIVRGHHTFMVGFDLDTRSYLTFSTSIIAIPTGIKILN